MATSSPQTFSTTLTDATKSPAAGSVAAGSRSSGGGERTIAALSTVGVAISLGQLGGANWPLPDGTKGLSLGELSSAASDDARAIATRQRHEAVHTLGNLTILGSALNSAQGNSAWRDKMAAMRNHSLLPLNQSAVELEAWDKVTILNRAKILFERARHVWGR